MRFDVLTLFPEMFKAVLNESIIGRAQDKELIQINLHNIREFSKDKHKKTDDYPYGGGKGMLMMIQPIFDTYMSITQKLDYKPRVIYLSPQGKLMNQKLVEEFAKESHLILLSGHYEGVDERVIEKIVDDEVSIGDYVLTGGELPAMVLIDAVSRLVPGVLSSEESFAKESHFGGLLEYPQYTRPYEFRGKTVPDILISGHHENINKWRRLESLKRTFLKRPDLFKEYDMTDEEKKMLKEFIKEHDGLKRD